MVKRYTQPCIQTRPGREFKVDEVPLFEDVGGKYVLASDYDEMSARASEFYERSIKLGAALREAADLRESDLDEADIYVHQWRELIGATSSDHDEQKA